MGTANFWVAGSITAKFSVKQNRSLLFHTKLVENAFQARHK